MAEDDALWPAPGERVGPYTLGGRVADDGEREWFRTYLADGEGGRVALHLTGGDAVAELMRTAPATVAAIRAHPRIRAVHATGVHEPAHAYRAANCPAAFWWLATAPDDGIPLPAWRVGRAWSEVLPVVRDVGEALVASESAEVRCHALLPDDIRIGADGRGRVDIGVCATLRRWVYDGVVAGGMVTGIREGAYMLPGMRVEGRDAPAGDGSTQRVFCAIAWEALFGRLPFGRTTLEHVMRAVGVDVVDPPAGEGVPDEIRLALMRGLAIDATERWPSLAALLTALTPRRRGWLSRLFGP